MHTIGKILKTIREERGLQLRQVAIESNIDLTLLSRIENGKRMPSESLLFKLAETYGLDSNLLVLQLVSDKILEISEQYPDHTIEALKIAQEKARLGERYISFFMNSFISRPIYNPQIQISEKSQTKRIEIADSRKTKRPKIDKRTTPNKRHSNAIITL